VIAKPFEAEELLGRLHRLTTTEAAEAVNKSC